MIRLWLAMHTEVKCLLELSVWFEKLRSNNSDSGKLYNINHCLWRGSYKAGHRQKCGRTSVRRNSGRDPEDWENIEQFEISICDGTPHNYSPEQMLHEGHSWLNYVRCLNSLLPPILIPSPTAVKVGEMELFSLKGLGPRVSNISPGEGSFKVYLCFVILAGLQKRLIP